MWLELRNKIRVYSMLESWKVFAACKVRNRYNRWEKNRLGTNEWEKLREQKVEKRCKRMRKTRFCKEPKTFSRGILLILNSSVSLPLGFSFALSCSRFFFLNCRLLLLLPHPLTSGCITPSHSRSHVLSIYVHYILTIYLLLVIEKRKDCHTEYIKKKWASNYMYKRTVNNKRKDILKILLYIFILYNYR